MNCIHYLVLIVWILSGFSTCNVEISQGVSLFSVVANVARNAKVTVNATCGENGQEQYCRLIEESLLMPSPGRHCDTCDSFYPVLAHGIDNIVDGIEKWWQSPSLAEGEVYQHVTITVDLGELHEVSHIIIKAAISPRPGNWVLERSVDGESWLAWQYFAVTDADCWLVYRTPPQKKRPKYLRDDQATCSSHYSQIDPLENGEVSVFLARGRLSQFHPSKKLLAFVSARYIRVRLQKLQMINVDRVTLRVNRFDDIDDAILRRYFYSIRELSVFAKCNCNGHAKGCIKDIITGVPRCECMHNTCGENCERCCPKYNHLEWKSRETHPQFECEACNCFGHADECVYNSTAAKLGLSKDDFGIPNGGGVCLNCKDYTTGVNCEQCVDGYYRPAHSLPTGSCYRCDCHVIGSTGLCIQDEKQTEEGLEPGDCICHEGYTGSRCERCTFGYQGYPHCRKCPCSIAGSIYSNPCGPCVCKENVEGLQCDRCKRGFYNLDNMNPEGCSECYCFHITDSCQSTSWRKEQIFEMHSWSVSSSPGRYPFRTAIVGGWLDHRTQLRQGRNDGVVQYWMAPIAYLGNRLTSYGGNLSYSFKYEARPDLIEGYIAAPDIILEGNGLAVARLGTYYRQNEETHITIQMVESEWMLLDQTIDRLIGTVSKDDFMSLLASLRSLTIRASYHRRQGRTRIKDIKLDAGIENSSGNVPMSSAEECHCRHGYAGLSCESCEVGYRRVNNTLSSGTCERCDCHEHAITCHAFTGICQVCLHNTASDRCEECIPGFYGDPKKGTPGDCKPCACPLNSAANNFASECTWQPTQEDSDSFICNDCRIGYTGNHCERCMDGYFGDPLLPGNFCQPCLCSGNVDLTGPGNCDSVTGECLKCLNHTMGSRCDECEQGYHGTAVNGDCQECNCSVLGAAHMDCDKDTGQCICLDHYTGLQCETCQAGFGNLKAGCVTCACSLQGSYHEFCEELTGQCVCKPGVTGMHCDHCKSGFYSFSAFGCSDCDCDADGTNTTHGCEQQTGQCLCLPHIGGQYCSECKDDHWNLTSGVGCQPCACHIDGSWESSCDDITGLCRCKPGITGQQCDECRHGFWGFSEYGCKHCDVCDLPWQICDVLTGKCRCPPGAQGDTCQECVSGHWGLDPYKGCKPCNCSATGSVSLQCDLTSGSCACKAGYTDDRCDKCVYGFYGYPTCEDCECDLAGTSSEVCEYDPSKERNNASTQICQCSNKGHCQCKQNVEGQNCSVCKYGAFSLAENKLRGCTPCFCFGRSLTCTDAAYSWDKIVASDRSLDVQFSSNLTLTHQNGILVIPLRVREVIRVSPSSLLLPLYWKLPANFSEDKVLSYGGQLQFTIYYKSPLDEYEGSGLEESSSTEDFGISEVPLVILQGERLSLGYVIEDLPFRDFRNHFTVILKEDYWQGVARSAYNTISREVFLVVLSNLRSILILAAPASGLASSIKLMNVQLDVASESGSGALSRETELCVCPHPYSGTSCQSAVDGYYRVSPSIPSYLEVGADAPLNLVSLIDRVEPCICHEHSDICHPRTGVCENCQHNTRGEYCHVCAEGYYGFPMDGTQDGCVRCPCPLLIESNNFSPSCIATRLGHICTFCDIGYTGYHCERCGTGFYGTPQIPGEICKPCECSYDGSYSHVCDHLTGQCNCLPGIIGRLCDQCLPNHAVVGGRCVSCLAGCPGKLMREIGAIEETLPILNITDVTLLPPWEKMERLQQHILLVQQKKPLEDALAFPWDAIMDKLRHVKNETTYLLDESKKFKDKILEVNEDVSISRRSASMTSDGISQLFMDLNVTVSTLGKRVWSLIYSKTGLDVNVTLPQMREIITDIETSDFTSVSFQCTNEHQLAQALHSRSVLLLAGVANAVNESQRLDDLTATLTDLAKKSDDSMDTSVEAQIIIGRIKKRVGVYRTVLARLVANTEDLESLVGDSQILLTESQNFVSLNEEDNNLSERQLSIGITALDRLARESSTMKMDLVLAREKVADAWIRTKTLEERALALNSTFASARNTSEDPLRAARAYDNIVQAISAARNASEQAVQNAQRTLDMAHNRTLQSMVEKINSTSRGQLVSTQNILNTDIPALQERLNMVISDVNAVTDSKNETQSNLEMTQDVLQRLSRGYNKSLVYINEMTDSVSEIVNKTRGRPAAIMRNVRTEIFPRLLAINPKEAEDIDKQAQAEVKSTRINIASVQNLTAIIESQSHSIRMLNSDIMQKLQNLEDKIQLARELANSVKIAMSCNRKCVRSYHVPTRISTTNTISLSFHTNTTHQDMLLFLLQNSPDDFLSIDIVIGMVRFTWNIRGSIGRVIHPEAIQSSTDAQQRWYQVTAHRLGQYGTIWVKPLFGLEVNVSPQSNVAASGNTLFKYGGHSDLLLGGLPEEHNASPAVSWSHFQGCMGEVYLDEQRIGVFNFLNTTDHCYGCQAVPVKIEHILDNVYQFSGRGYAQVGSFSDYHDHRYLLSLKFKTYWENALIMYSVNNQTGDFISIELEGGHVKFQYYMGGTSLGVLKSQYTYNNNDWVTLEARRNYLEGILWVNDERIVGSAPPSNKRLELKDSDIYFGGIPHGVADPRYPVGVRIERMPFLGCIKNVTLGSAMPKSKNLLEGRNVGVTPGCQYKIHRVVDLPGDGYVRLPLNPDLTMLQGVDVSLMFNAHNPNGLLLLASDDMSQNFLSLALVDGQVEARIGFPSSHTVILRSVKTYIDYETYSLSLRIDADSIKLLLDDTVEADSYYRVMDEGSMTITHFFIGGVPAQVEVGNKAAISDGFQGCISDVLINGRLLEFNNPDPFYRADVGRCSMTLEPTLRATLSPLDHQTTKQMYPDLTGRIFTVSYGPGTTSEPPVTISGAQLPTTEQTDKIGHVDQKSFILSETSIALTGSLVIVEPTKDGSVTQTVSPIVPSAHILPSHTILSLSSTSKAHSTSQSSEHFKTDADFIWLRHTLTKLVSDLVRTIVPLDSVDRLETERAVPSYLEPTLSAFTSEGAAIPDLKPDQTFTHTPSVIEATKLLEDSEIHSSEIWGGGRIIPEKLPHKSTIPELEPTKMVDIFVSEKVFSKATHILEDDRDLASKQVVSEKNIQTTTPMLYTPMVAVIPRGEHEEVEQTSSVLLETYGTNWVIGIDVTAAGTDRLRKTQILPDESDDVTLKSPVVTDHDSSPVPSPSRQTDHDETVGDLFERSALDGRVGTLVTTGDLLTRTLIKPVEIKPVESDIVTEASPLPIVTDYHSNIAPSPSRRDGILNTRIVPSSLELSPATMTSEKTPVPQWPLTEMDSLSINPSTDIRMFITSTSVGTSVAPTVMSSVITMTTPTLPTKPTLPPTACAHGGPYVAEKDASAFGNAKYSFAELKVRRRAVRKDFNISFDFRTFKPSGMFFYLTNEDQSDYVAAQLMGGHVVVWYNDRGSPTEIKTLHEYADGAWHNVAVTKGRSVIYLTVDKDDKTDGDIARRLDVQAPMYVGGLPRGYRLRQGLVPHSVRGCLRGFEINGAHIDLRNTTVISGISPCHTSVERGIHFTGYSYGLYDPSFLIGPYMFIQLDFRTHKKNGILLTASSYQGYPAMTLEMHKGRLKMSIRTEEGVLTASTKHLIEFDLCDQQWHTLKVDVMQNVITIWVDAGEQAYGIGNRNYPDDRLPLFIGGFPNYAQPQGASFSSSNFQGCMRNVIINGIPVDWYNMEQSVDIHRTSCPLLT